MEAESQGYGMHSKEERNDLKIFIHFRLSLMKIKN